MSGHRPPATDFDRRHASLSILHHDVKHSVAIGDALFNTYITHAFGTGSEDHFVQQEEQQQQHGPRRNPAEQ